MQARRRPGSKGPILMGAGFLSLALATAPSCGQSVDFKQALQVIDVTGGWYDFGIVDGKNKLVPSMTFRIRKTPDVRLQSVAVNVHFKWISAAAKESKDAEEQIDEVFLQTVEFSEGNQTALLTVRPETGYTGDAPLTRAQMLEHSLFRDARARIFAKQSSTTWVELLSYDIPRVLISK